MAVVIHVEEVLPVLTLGFVLSFQADVVANGFPRIDVHLKGIVRVLSDCIHNVILDGHC